MAAATADKQIFKDVFFSIIQGPKLTKDAVAELEEQLLSFGGVKIDLVKDDKTGVETVDLHEVTHIIAEDIEFSYYPQIEQQKNNGEVDERMIPVVTPKWATESIAKSRMLHVRAFNPDPRYFFSGIQVTAADLPEGDKEAIYGGVLALGGQYSSQLTKLTTHLVAINLENDRCRQAIDKKLNIKIVLPHWFDDCLKLNRRIPEGPYLLPNAEIEQKLATDPLPIPTLDFNFIHAHPDGRQGPPEVTRKFKGFTGKRFYFARDLKLHQQLLGTLETIINHAGGEVAKSLQSANVVLCNWRQCDEYVQGSRKGMDVGNLTWLYWMIAKGQWASPLKMLLHYPRDKNGVPGMENMIITVSNYGGDARLYLENLIEACGARFTRAMKTENTHLITARDSSDKCAAAREWGIEMVNHLWLEETYARCQIQPMSNLKYTTFPKRTNLMEVVGQTRVDLPIMQELYWENREEDVDMTDAPDTSRTTNVTTDTVGPSSGAPEPTSSMSEITPRPEKTTKTKTKAKAPHETPSRMARLSSPVSVMSSGSRRAKDNANIKLHNEIMPDVMNYEKEKKRKGGVLGAGRKRSLTPTNDKESDRTAKRRGTSVDAEPDNSESSEDEATTKDKSKKSKKRVPISVFLLLTAHQPWLDTPSREEGDKKKLRSIGIQCIENPDSSITHLSAPHMVRTQKFVCALAYAPTIVSASWVEACLSSSSIVDTSPHILHDTAGEARLNLKLSDSLVRAKRNKQNLLKGMHIYMTPSVPGGFETLKKVIEVNGGICTMFKTAKRNAILPPSASDTKQNTNEDGEGKDESEGEENVNDGRLLLLSTTDDSKIWKPFEKMAEQVGWKPIVFKTEWLLDVAMRQRLLWGDEYVLQPQQGKKK